MEVTTWCRVLPELLQAGAKPFDERLHADGRHGLAATYVKAGEGRQQARAQRTEAFVVQRAVASVEPHDAGERGRERLERHEGRVSRAGRGEL